MAVETTKTAITTDLQAHIRDANTTTNQISHTELFDLLTSILGLAVVESTTSRVPVDRLPDADTDNKGVVELATDGESDSTSITDKAITPQGMHAGIAAYGAEDFPQAIRNDDNTITEVSWNEQLRRLRFGRLNNSDIDITISGGGSGGGGLSQPQVDARVRALVQLFARDSVTDIPDSKVSNNIARLANINPNADPEPVSTSANRGTGNRMARQDHVHARGDILQSEITTAVENIVGEMVSGNTETGISVTKVGDKLNFVVTVSGGGSNTPVTDQSYAAWSATDNTFTAAEMKAGIASTNGSLAISTATGGGYFYFAIWHTNALTAIRNSTALHPGENQIGSFTQSRLTIDSVNGYLYTYNLIGGQAPLRSNGINATWTLEE